MKFLSFFSVVFDVRKRCSFWRQKTFSCFWRQITFSYFWRQKWFY